MELKNFFAQDLAGNVIASPTVYIYQPGTATLATGLQDKNGAALTNPFTGTVNGFIQFAAPDGDYDLRVTGAGRDFTMRVRFVDASPSSVQMLREDLAASGGAALVGFDWAVLPSAINNVDWGIQTAGTGVNVLRYVPPSEWAAILGGTSNYNAAPAIQAALTNNLDVFAPAGLFNIGQKLVTRPGQQIKGAGKYNTKFKKTFDGDLIDASAGMCVEGIWWEGDGAVKTGRGFVFGAATPRAEIKGCRIINFDGYCVEFAVPNAGSLFTMNTTEIYRTVLANPAIKCPTDTASAPRTFTDCYTTGGNFIDCGGADNVLINGCHINTLVFNAGKKVMLTGTRIASVGETLVFSGLDSTMVGCAIAGPVEIAGTANSMNMTGCMVAGGITLLPGCQNTTVRNNQCTGAVVDNSGNGTNRVDIGLTTYSPTWTTSGTAPVLGNGTLIGRYSRQGNIVKATIEFQAGSTTTFGSGEFRFSLPFTSAAAIQQTGSARILDSGNVFLAAVSVVQASRLYVIVHGHSAAGPVSDSSPFVWAANDSITLEITYSV